MFFYRHLCSQFLTMLLRCCLPFNDIAIRIETGAIVCKMVIVFMCLYCSVCIGWNASCVFIDV